MIRKPNEAAALRDAATTAVNEQLSKLEEHARHGWSADAERAVTIDAAILHAWSSRETAGHIAETAETLMSALEPIALRVNHDVLNLIDTIDEFNTVTKASTSRLARWTAVMAVVTAALVATGIVQAWLLWTSLRH